MLGRCRTWWAPAWPSGAIDPSKSETVLCSSRAATLAAMLLSWRLLWPSEIPDTRGQASRQQNALTLRSAITHLDLLQLSHEVLWLLSKPNQSQSDHAWSTTWHLVAS